jgi:AbiV family abortive infection protein
MTNDEFNSASKELILEGAQLCHRNAYQHYLCAQQIAFTKNFGIANSLLILASEECIKSMILSAGYFNIELPFKVNDFFRYHNVKHKQAEEMQQFIATLSFLGKALAHLFKKRKPSQFGLAFDVVFIVTFVRLLEKIWPTNGKRLSDFWGGANEQKKKGFYVDFVEGKWSSPFQFQERQFKKSMKIIKPFIDMTRFVEMVNQDDYKEFQKLAPK